MVGCFTRAPMLMSYSSMLVQGLSVPCTCKGNGRRDQKIALIV